VIPDWRKASLIIYFHVVTRIFIIAAAGLKLLYVIVLYFFALYMINVLVIL